MPIIRIVSAVALTLAVGQGTPPATPSAQSSTGLIAGQVMDATTNRPVADMVVTLTVPGAPAAGPGAATAGQRKVLTDGSGRFAFSNLAAGRYSVTAVRAGYVAGALGKLAARGPGAPLQLREGERVVDARILVWKYAAIRGRVTDEAGEPVVGTWVRVLRRSMVSGRSGYSDLASAKTDDRGEYRAAGLGPGAYIVGVYSTSTALPLDTLDEYNTATGDARTALQRVLFAAAPTMTSLGASAHQIVGDYLVQVEGRLAAPPIVAADGTVWVYPTSFHGGTSDASEAQILNVAAGEQRAGVDVVLRRTRVFRLSGTIGAPGGTAPPTPLVLWPASLQSAFLAHPIASTVSEASGRFTFLAVPPGQYILRAGSTSWVTASVTVTDRDVASINLLLQPGFRMAGRLAVEGDTASLPMNRMFVNLEAMDQTLLGDFSETQVGSDGTFRSAEAPLGRYRLTLPLPSGWFVKSVTSKGQMLEDLPFELKESLDELVITVSSRGAQLNGSVRTTAGAADATAAVLVFPVDSRQWIDFSAYARGIKDVRAGRDGAFAIVDLPEGDYFAIAIAQQQLDWGQPRFFETLSRLATRVTLGPGESRALDLRTVVVKW